MKYNSKWCSKNTGNVFTIGQSYVQHGVEYFFLSCGMYSKMLRKDVIELYFEEVLE